MSKIRILLLEDNLGDAYLVREQLKDIDNFDCEITEVQYLEQALELLQTQFFDAILLDLMLPDSQGIETFFAINQQAPHTAIIVISALTEETLATLAVQKGAQDYLPKGKIQPQTLGKTVKYAIERKSITEQLRKRTEELEYLNQELEAFSYTVSHDLKNPLNFIKGMSSLLLSKKRSQPLEPQDELCIQRIHKNSMRMEQITQNLLNLSQAQRSQMLIETINLSKLALEIIDQLQQQQPDRKIDFIVAPDMIAQGDRQLVKLALENLLGNAWKYTQNLTKSSIEFGVSHDNSSKAYYIKDNGIGFSTEEATELFTPFQRLSNSSQIEGTGIGLATVKRIIDRHQGKVWFEAQPNRGASFFFTLL